jgi:hypothetical protein
MAPFARRIDMNFYNKCHQCGKSYHVSNAYGCPACNNALLIQIEMIDHQIKQLQKQRVELAKAYEAEQRPRIDINTAILQPQYSGNDLYA